VNPARASKGLVVILPGIEGRSAANRNIRRGLDDADIPYALSIYEWGFPVPGIGMVINQTHVAGIRDAGRKLAERVVLYQQRYPDRPVHLIGHSAGGGVAVFTLEALGQIGHAEPIEGAFLLSASISADYDLDAALHMARKGIVNVYNPDDLALLGAGALIMGNVDGGRGAPAGRIGFTRKYHKVFERKITAGSVGVVSTPHFASTHADVITAHAPAWLLSPTWPPAAADGD